jgi:uroporphyrinogen-III synthase
MAASLPLRGKGVLVTRPAHQARQLTQLIEAAGGEPILFPALEILDSADPGALNTLIARLDDFDLAIFISPNAASRGMALIRAQRELPPHLAIAAIGSGSRKALEQWKVGQILMPQNRFDSEGLLDLPEFQDMRGKRVVIFRGEGGREMLGDTLVARGAQLEYAECYRRARPVVDPSPLLQRWARGEVQAVTVTSGESLRNLSDMLGNTGQAWLRKTPLVAPHEKIGANARDMGVERVWITAAGDEALVKGVIECLTQKKT